jgi:hypothetical protein
MEGRYERCFTMMVKQNLHHSLFAFCAPALPSSGALIFYSALLALVVSM